jgi:hypothetical protein
MRMFYLPRALSSLCVALTMLPLHLHAQQQSDAQPFKFMNTSLPRNQRSRKLPSTCLLDSRESTLRLVSPPT